MLASSDMYIIVCCECNILGTSVAFVFSAVSLLLRLHFYPKIPRLRESLKYYRIIVG